MPQTAPVLVRAGKRGGPPVIKQVAKESFFNFFTALPMPDEDAEDEEEVGWNGERALLTHCLLKDL